MQSQNPWRVVEQNTFHSGRCRFRELERTSDLQIRGAERSVLVTSKYIPLIVFALWTEQVWWMCCVEKETGRPGGRERLQRRVGGRCKVTMKLRPANIRHTVLLSSASSFILKQQAKTDYHVYHLRSHRQWIHDPHGIQHHDWKLSLGYADEVQKRKLFLRVSTL